MDRLFEKMIEFCKEKMGSDPVSGFDHVQRVLRWCELIGKAEAADLTVLRAAAILHDVGVPQGRKIHHEVGAEMADQFLTTINFPSEKIAAVTTAIRGHSRYGGPDPTTLEGYILRDADMLDFIGTVGIVRAILRDFQAEKYTGAPETIPTLVDNLKKRISGKFYTEIGKKTGEILFQAMDQFVTQLKNELNPKSLL
jgi:uncharacterized protein